MKKLVSSIFIAALIVSCNKTEKSDTDKTLIYPETRKDTVVDTYFGENINDYYRWLEDDRSEETAGWVTAQNEVTFAYLDQIPYREQLRKQLEDRWNYEKIGAPFVEGNYTYYYKNDGLQNQSVLYRKGSDGKEEIFLDPNTFSKDGTTSLASVSFTEDGSLVVYAISEGGSDWRKVIVLNAEDKTVIGDTLIDVKFSGLSWYKNEGFYYSSYDKPDGSELSAKTDEHKLYYHKLNTPQTQDRVVFGDKTKRRYVGGYVTDDQNYLVITAANATSGNELYLQDLNNPNGSIQTIVTGFENDYSIIDSKDGKLYIVTNFNAPNKKLMVVEASSVSNRDSWKDVISETENVLSLSKAGGYFFAHYMKDAVSVVEQYEYNGSKVREIELPGLGTASGFGDKNDAKELYFSFTNYVTPGSIYKMDITTGASEIYQQPKVKFNPDDYESKQVFYESKDGTRVPMMITYKKGTKLDGNNPTMLYAYGEIGRASCRERV